MKLRITIEGTTYDVEVEVLDAGSGAPLVASAAPASPPAPPALRRTAEQLPDRTAAPPPSPPPGPGRTAGQPPDRTVTLPSSAPPATGPFAAQPPARTATPPTPADRLSSLDGDRVCRAPLPGTVTQIRVRPGERVHRNQTLVVLEAMKMESSVGAPADGTVKSVLVKLGASVKEGEVLVEFE